MNDNAAHIATLRALADDFVDSSAALFTAERQALDAAIRALSADRGEAALPEPFGFYDSDEREFCLFATGSDPHSLDGYREVTYVYSRAQMLARATPPSPAESAAPSPSYDALLLMMQSVCGALERAGITDCDDPGEAIDVLREGYEKRLSAAPSGVSDAAALLDIAEAVANAPIGRIHSRYGQECYDLSHSELAALHDKHVRLVVLPLAGEVVND